MIKRRWWNVAEARTVDKSIQPTVPEKTTKKDFGF